MDDFGGKIWLLVSIATNTVKKILGPFFIISHQIGNMYQFLSKSVTMRAAPPIQMVKSLQRMAVNFFGINRTGYQNFKEGVL